MSSAIRKTRDWGLPYHEMTWGDLFMSAARGLLEINRHEFCRQFGLGEPPAEQMTWGDWCEWVYRAMTGKELPEEDIDRPSAEEIFYAQQLSRFVADLPQMQSVPGLDPDSDAPEVWDGLCPASTDYKYGNVSWTVVAQFECDDQYTKHVVMLMVIVPIGGRTRWQTVHVQTPTQRPTLREKNVLAEGDEDSCYIQYAEMAQKLMKLRLMRAKEMQRSANRVLEEVRQRLLLNDTITGEA